ncbi:MAG: tetratricopeptide repeat protein [Acidobacteriota bacterium]
MKRTFILLAIAVAACAPTTPAPTVAPGAEDRYLIDPRAGFGSANASIDKRFGDAWRAVIAGDFADARRRLADIRAKDPAYAPAALAEAAIELREGRADAARAIVDRVRAERPQYLAAEVYAAEVAVAEKRTRDAYELYRAIATRPDAPSTAAERLGDLQTRLFDDLHRAALAAPDEAAIATLREALQVNPAAGAARILLAQKLVALRRFEDARKEIEPVLGTADADRADVQQVLAEVDVSRGRYEEAIARYERMVRRGSDPRMARRLDELKTQFAEANMPLQFKRAIEDESITRADLAVLMYWQVASVRFAQNLPAPPIAIDVSETPGREELIRAIALGVYHVDPVTRRVNPASAVNAGGLTRITARLLALRGAGCARGIPQSDPSRILAACGITDPSLAGSDQAVSGRTASMVMEQVDRALK